MKHLLICALCPILVIAALIILPLAKEKIGLTKTQIKYVFEQQTKGK